MREHEFEDDTFTRFLALLLHAYVARGAAWLDDHAPGWAPQLLGFLPGIHMQNPNECIVGTLLRTDFVNGVGSAAGFHRFDAFLEKNNLGNGGQYGFNVPTEDWALGHGNAIAQNHSQCWSALLEAWQHEIHRRVTPDDVAVTIGRFEAKALAQQGNEAAREAIEAAEETYREAESERESAESELEEARDGLSEAKETFESAREEHDAACNRSDEAEEALKQARETHKAALADSVDYEAAIVQLQEYLRTSNPLPVFP